MFKDYLDFCKIHNHKQNILIDTTVKTEISEPTIGKVSVIMFLFGILSTR